MKSLGIWIHSDISVMNILNQNEILERVDKNTKVYQNVRMNLYSKIFIINTKVISQINYLASSVEIDKDTISSLKKKILDFLWDGKTHKIKYTTIIGDYNEGGIRLVDIECKIRALQIGWVKRTRQGQTWEKIFNSINKVSWERVVNFNIDLSQVRGDFYKQVLRSWQELYFNETFLDNVIKQPVIYNRNLKIGGEMITKFNDDTTIGDILNNAILTENRNLSLLIYGVRSAIPKHIKDYFKNKPKAINCPNQHQYHSQIETNINSHIHICAK